MDLDAAVELVNSLAFDRADVSALLPVSAGLQQLDPTPAPPTTAYRPYAVAAFLWITSKNTQRLLEARGTRFDKPDKMIDGLLQSQAVLDEGMTGIPAAWTVSALRDRLRSGDRFTVEF